MIFNKYIITARVFPAIISAIPLLILILRIANKDLKELFDEILALQILGDLTISIVIIYLGSQISRFLGKEVFENKYFQDELNMPTTDFLLYGNEEFSSSYKDKMRNKIQNDFGINIPKELEDENITEVRKRIVEAVGLIRNYVKDGKLLLQHNIEYGFVRNLIGGSVIGAIFSLFNIFYFTLITPKLSITIISGVLVAFFIGLLSFSKVLIQRYGKLYAKRLFQEYLTKES
jgi:hypothetical protein